MDWFVHNRAYEEAIGRCINDRDAYKKQSELCKKVVTEDSFSPYEYIFNYKFLGGFVVGMSIAGLIYYAAKK